MNRLTMVLVVVIVCAVLYLVAQRVTLDKRIQKRLPFILPIVGIVIVLGIWFAPVTNKAGFFSNPIVGVWHANMVTTSSGFRNITPGSYVIDFRKDGLVMIDYGNFPEKALSYEILDNQEIKIKQGDRQIIITYFLDSHDELSLVGDIRADGADKEETTILQRAP